MVLPDPVSDATCIKPVDHIMTSFLTFDFTQFFQLSYFYYGHLTSTGCAFIPGVFQRPSRAEESSLFVNLLDWVACCFSLRTICLSRYFFFFCPTPFAVALF